jgi:hypothetical protein
MELIFEVRDGEEGGYCARALGHAIFTEAETWDELRANVLEATSLHFEDGPACPQTVSFARWNAIKEGSHVRLRHEGPPAHSIPVPLHNPLKSGMYQGILSEVALKQSIARKLRNDWAAVLCAAERSTGYTGIKRTTQKGYWNAENGEEEPRSARGCPQV